MKKRILASLMALCLAVGLLPTAALAADEDRAKGEEPAPGCICETLCTNEAGNSECPVCAENVVECLGTAPVAPPAQTPAETITDPETQTSSSSEDPVAAPRSAWEGDEYGKGTKENPWDISYEGSGNDVDAYLLQNNADGDNPTYTCYITGTGKAATYSIDYDRLPPWWDQVDQITKVVVEDGITWIHDDGFSGAELLTEVELPSSLEYLGDYFSKCPALTSVTFPEGNPDRWRLGARAF